METKTAEYNGWANRSTWNIALWIFNDQDLYREVWDNLDACSPMIRADKFPVNDFRQIVMTVFSRMNNLDPERYEHDYWEDPSTPDGVWLTSPEVNWDDLYRACREEFRL